MLESAIHITNLFKIFGPKPQSMLRHVRNGISKLEILDKHKHVVARTHKVATIATKPLLNYREGHDIVEPRFL